MNMPDFELDRLREEIDRIDETILDLLERRFDATRKVGAWKARNAQRAIDPSREAAQFERYRGIAARKAIDQALVSTLFRAIVDRVVAEHAEIGAGSQGPVPHHRATGDRVPDPLPSAVIFDMDGTLLDTEQIGVRAWIAAFAEHGIHIDRSTAILPIGSDARRTLDIFRHAVGGDHDFEAIQRRCHEIFHEIAGREGIPLKPGAMQILSKLRSRGVLVGLATSTRKESAQPELREVGLLEYFDATVFGDEVSERKPSPEIYLEALRRLGLDGSEAVWAVEDSANGVLSAHAAGLRVAHIPDLQTVDPLVAAKAHVRLPSLEHLAEFFSVS
jgi:HAD superfamily hydrolase (TIGR01509 family)